MGQMSCRDVIPGMLTILQEPPCMAEFLSFMAQHPEFSPENLILLYAQRPKAARYAASPEDARRLGISASNPVVLLDVCLREGKLGLTERFMCMVTEDAVPEAAAQRSVRAILNRKGLAIAPGPGNRHVHVDSAAGRMYVPAGCTRQERDGMIADHLVGMFHDSFDASAMFGEGGKGQISRKVLQEMFHIYLATEGGVAAAWDEEILKYYSCPRETPDVRFQRLMQVCLLYSELIQFVEGPHFTMADTGLYLAAGWQLSSGEFDVEETAAGGSLPWLLQLFCRRMAGRAPEEITAEDVRYYPPLKLESEAERGRRAKM